VGEEKAYYEHIDRIAARINASIDYLVQGKTTEKESLSRREKEIVECFRQLTDQTKDIIVENVRLLTNV